MRAVCTICSCNYLHHAQVLAESLEKTNPELTRYLLLVDLPEHATVAEGLGWDIVTIDKLSAICNIEQLLFRYTQLEANTALKPYFLETLFTQYSITEVVYVDPDTAFFGSLCSVWELLQNNEAVLTPHITKPFADNYSPTDLQINRAGTVNLGFIALRKSANTARLLTWWQQKLRTQGYMALDEGLHVDQKWMDFAPALLQSCVITKDPRLNIAYWNLHYRGEHLNFQDEILYYDSIPAIFFHFSGLSQRNIQHISKHQNRFRAKNFKALTPLLQWYKQRLKICNSKTYSRIRYHYNYYDNGVRISEKHRRLFRSLGIATGSFKNPFSSKGKDSYFEYATESLLLKALDFLPSATVLMYRLSLKGIIARTRARVAHMHRVQNPSPVLQTNTRNGVNIVGFFENNFGVATAAQNTLTALEIAEIPHNKFPLHLKDQYRGIITKLSAVEISKKYPTTIWHINAYELPYVAKSLYPQLQVSSKNIGVFYWETEEFPTKWRKAFDYLDEVWTASRYCENSLQRATQLPVRHIRFPITTQHISNARERFHFPKNAFIVLFCFDFCSQTARKNPQAVIEVFKKTLSRYPEAMLVIKSINHRFFPIASKIIDSALQELPAIHLKQSIASEDFDALINTCDVYMSLHRAEGFGLNLIKAMLLAKPVIATNYSGNTDFMNYENSFPVEYRLSELQKNYGPYQQGTCWAEPDLNHASEQLISVYRNRDRAKEKALKGKASVTELYSPQTCGQQIKELLHNMQDGALSSENIIVNG